MKKIENIVLVTAFIFFSVFPVTWYKITGSKISGYEFMRVFWWYIPLFVLIIIRIMSFEDEKTDNK